MEHSLIEYKKRFRVGCVKSYRIIKKIAKQTSIIKHLTDFFQMSKSTCYEFVLICEIFNFREVQYYILIAIETFHQYKVYAKYLNNCMQLSFIPFMMCGLMYFYI